MRGTLCRLPLISPDSLHRVTECFSLHAATTVDANDHPGRERLCGYVNRPRWPMDACSSWTRTGSPSP
jgi:hypothetical protein